MLKTFTLHDPHNGAPHTFGRDSAGAWFTLIGDRPPKPLANTPFTVTPLLEHPLEHVQRAVATLGSVDDFPYWLAVEGSFRLRATFWLPKSLSWVKSATLQGESWPRPFLERFEAVAQRESESRQFRDFQRSLRESLDQIRQL